MKPTVTTAVRQPIRRKLTMATATRPVSKLEVREPIWLRISDANSAVTVAVYSSSSGALSRRCSTASLNPRVSSPAASLRISPMTTPSVKPSPSSATRENRVWRISVSPVAGSTASVIRLRTSAASIRGSDARSSATALAWASRSAIEPSDGPVTATSTS